MKVEMLEMSPTSGSFQDEVTKILCQAAEKGWKLKQAMQLRANLFMFLFETAN